MSIGITQEAIIIIAQILTVDSGSPGIAPCELAKLVPSRISHDDSAGYAVSAGDGIAVIGVPMFSQTGMAAVFTADGAGWEQAQVLLAADADFDDRFGRSVSVSGDVAIIGAPGDDENGGLAGAAYVFRFDGSKWLAEQKLLAPDGDATDSLGTDVSIDGDVALIGAAGDDTNGINAGSAAVFRFDRDGSRWVHEQTLMASDGAAQDGFGWRVSVHGDLAVIGAPSDDDNGGISGSAYAFRRRPGAAPGDGPMWTEQAKLVPDDGATGDLFGYSVAVFEDTALVGALGDDDQGRDSGAVYVFRYDGSVWRQDQKMLAPNGTGGEAFAYVALDQDLAMVGAPGSLSVHVFRHDGEAYVHDATLQASDGASGDAFGFAVSVSAETALIGAPGNDETARDAGAAYVYALGPDCNDNGAADRCDILDGTSDDDDGNGIPDECECAWDLDGDGDVTGADVAWLVGAWGTDPGGPPDFNGDGSVSTADLLALLANWESCG